MRGRLALTHLGSHRQGINPSRLSSYVIRRSSALIALTFSTCSLDRRPCFVCAAIVRALPSSVRGPVLLPPCNLQRVRPPMGGFWHAPPARVFAPHLRPGQPGPKRVSMPASIRAVWLTLFTIYFRRSRGWASINLCQALSEGSNPVPSTAHRDHLTTAPAPRDKPLRPPFDHAFGAASVARSGSICRCRHPQPRPARP